MAVRTPDPEPGDRDDDDSPRDPLRPGGAPFDRPGHPLGGSSLGSRVPGSAQNPGWLSEVELAEARRRLPMLYVEAVPVRTDGVGAVTEVGILLRATPLGEITRTIVSGRVRYGETVRDALFRHVENDLGPMAFPLLPPQPVPFTVAEYFPIPGVSAFHDDRQHAVSLAFVVPVSGTCEPRQDALEVTWMTPEEASSDAVSAEMEGGRGTLVRLALASVGALR
ncbi:MULTISPECIES: NUDIX hydrolase family protein [unclassified Microbacterium]|uniref:NUDIX hydrolase family protein n=1 Tax=unclassified Microbacterium TaxID=2609290 RepID=UPI00214B2EB8|nr:MULTISPECIES: NUDIX hydrolase family protein [unclassified Microbacterium]MCR2802181.1 NUDIX hydrolase family protein [Microbacterium sp. zg.Y818]MCR2826951.1 NUDIX hydrolase family protein [Microbacterium sp. zg.Y909]WIM22727.1 NUDIX hydrolase family protein [Microbacterium sp. zg-Y818]